MGLGKRMTPEKRATLVKVVAFGVVCLLLVGGYITQDAWLAFVLRS
jgi:hypothetical protein